MRERRLLLKCRLKISRPADSYEPTTCSIVELWLGHGLMTGPSGAPCRILRRRRYSQWIRMSELAYPSGSASSGQKRIFAIVSPPIPTSVNGKAIRRIVIFDNHPDSLRLVLQSGVNVEGDDAVSRRERRTSIICGLILIAMLVAGLLWALCG